MVERDQLHGLWLGALAQDGCPACRLGAAMAGRFIQTLFYEQTTDPATRGRFDAGLGLCREHGAMALAAGDVLAVAVFHESVLAELVRRLDAAGGAGLWQRAEPLRQSCLVCAETARYEGVLWWGLHRYLKADPAFASAWAGGPGLCVPHLDAALAAVPDRAAGRRLAAAERDRLAALRADVQALIDHFDYRQAGAPPRPGVADAWRRAVRQTSGAR